MNNPVIPRMPELPLDEFDAEYRQAEIEHPAELETMIAELETAAGMVPLTGLDFFPEVAGRRWTSVAVSVPCPSCWHGRIPMQLSLAWTSAKNPSPMRKRIISQRPII
jgi:hypothetical protein